MASVEDFSQSFSLTSASLSNISLRLQNAYGKPLIQRCREIEDILKTSSNKDLRNSLPALLENIFGFGSEPGWGLDVISKSQNPHEYEAVLRLLDPEGPLLSFIYSLQTDIYLTYEFPFSCCPAPTRHMIEDRSIPIFYVNKLQYQNYGKPVIALSAFEFYLFHFCYVLVNPQWQTKPYNWSNMSDIVYPCLFDNYLRHFLPLNKKSLPKFPQTKLSPVRSPMMQQQSPHASSKHTPGSGTHPRTRSHLGLFKANLLTPQKPHTQGSPVSDKMEAEIWWSETFLQVVAEFWLNQNSLEVDRTVSNQTLLHSTWYGHGSLQDPYTNIFKESFALEIFSPSNNHVRLTRLFLKHVHLFVSTAAPETITAQYQTPEVSPLDEFKRSLLPQVLQKKMYTFLKHNFERWPLDTSFRYVLELWLTYIQPWRYVEPSQHRTRVERDSEREQVDDCWFPFIRDNFLFYSTLLQDFLQRARRMHLTSVQNAYMVFRVSKVLSLPNLVQLMREVEKMMYSSAFKTSHQDLGGTYIAPEISMVLRVQISELERSDFNYCNLFGNETLAEVHGVLQLLSAARSTLVSATPEKQKRKKSGWASFLDFSSLFEDNVKVYGDLSATEVKKLVAHLDQTVQNLCRIFSISSPESFLSTHGTEGDSSHADHSSVINQTYTISAPSTPDCVQTDHGPQLTPAGRYQLMNGLRKFDIGYQGDPDLQPIRSFENKTLVRALYRLSAFVNKHYGAEIESLYNRHDIIGRMSQIYFSAPLSPRKTPSSPVSQQTFETLQTPRLSLRFLANYQTLLYLGLVYLILRYLWGVGPVGYILFLMVCVLVYGFFRAMISKDEVKVD